MLEKVICGRPYATNPHVLLDAGEVASARPRRGSLFYKKQRLKSGLGFLIALLWWLVPLYDAQALTTVSQGLPGAIEIAWDFISGAKSYNIYWKPTYPQYGTDAFSVARGLTSQIYYSRGGMLYEDGASVPAFESKSYFVTGVMADGSEWPSPDASAGSVGWARQTSDLGERTDTIIGTNILVSGQTCQYHMMSTWQLYPDYVDETDVTTWAITSGSEYASLSSIQTGVPVFYVTAGNVSSEKTITLQGTYSGRKTTKTITIRPRYYTVTFDANGGSIAEGERSRLIRAGFAVGELPTPMPTTVNCVFDGWYTAAAGGVRITNGTKISANVTYYAHWNKAVFEIDNGILTYVSDNGVTDITIPDGVTSIGESAFSCSDLTSVTIPNSVTSIGDYAFSDCYYLTSVTIPDGVTSIGSGAFECCFGLTSVTIPDSVTSIGSWAFCDCSGLTSVTIPDSVTSIGTGAFGFGGYEGCCSLTSVTIGNGVTSIGSWAFEDCSSLTSVTIPDSVTSIGEGTFSGCNAALFDTTTISGVRLVDGWAVGHGDSLSGDLNLTGIRGIGGGAFSGCGGLTSVTIPDGVPSIGNQAFSGCSGLTSVTIPDGVTSIGNQAFYDCSGLTSVTIPNSVTNVGLSAFSYCTNLTSVTIPDSVTSIGSYAFRDCSGLTSVTIGNGVTSIGAGAFEDCNGLKHVIIPDSVTSIGQSVSVFYGCRGLTNIMFQGNAPSLEGDSTVFSSVGPGCIAYVKRSSTGWGVEIPGKWNGMSIRYMTPMMEIEAANAAGRGIVEMDGELPQVEVAAGVTVVVRGENLNADALAAKVAPLPHEAGQSSSFFKVVASVTAGSVSLSVALDEKTVDPDGTAGEIVGASNVAAFGAAADGASVSVNLPSAKPGLYYGIAAASDLSQLESAAASAPLVRADAEGATVPVAKPTGGAAFFKVIISDRAR